MTIVWGVGSPRNRDQLRQLTSTISTQKAAFEERIERHFVWSGSTVSAGSVKLSTTTPGAARMFFGPRSEVSQPSKNGVGMIVSDESRLIFFNSEQSSYVGGQGAMLVENPALYGATANDGARWVADHGVFTTTSIDGTERVAFNVTYGAAPVTVQITNSGDNSGASFAIAVTDIDVSSFSLGHEYVGPGSSVAGEVQWRSLGTVAL